MDHIPVNLDLVRKYNQPGPRYTSYPTAPHFTDETPHDALIAEVEAGDGPLSLYFHLPFCESLCWFCGCTTVITLQHDLADKYLDTVEREVARVRSHIKDGRPTVQLHFGGGTPNFLTPKQIGRLSGIIRDHFDFTADIEASVEIDPRRLTKEHIAAFRELGMNRASFGVQDIKEDVQKAIHRVQSMDDNRSAVQWLQETGFQSFNIDLIYGLPHQSVESFQHTLDEIIALGPNRLAVFSYAHVPWIKPAQKLLERAHLPDAETKLQMLAAIIEKLTTSGYAYIGMDHFAKADDELAVAQREKTLHRNFQGYSTRAGVEICGFGMSSISQTRRSYRQNLKDLPVYQSAVEGDQWPIERGLILTEEDLLRREVIMRIMCQLELNYPAINEEFGIDFKAKFAPDLKALDEMVRDGLVVLEDDKLTVTTAGRLYIRNIAMHFDEHIRKGIGKYSKTV